MGGFKQKSINEDFQIGFHSHIVETIEIPANDFFVGVQFHPEFKSRPNRAHPLFKGFIEASLNIPV